MTRHLDEQAMADFFQGSMTVPDSEAHAVHLVSCRPCWVRASPVLEHIHACGTLAPGPIAAAVVRLMREEERYEGRVMRARSLLSELKKSPPHEQRQRLRSVVSVHSQLFFEAILEEVAVLWHADPYAAEHMANLARELATLLPRRRFPEPQRNNFEAEALTYIANCRRLSADWKGAQAAITEAQDLLKKGVSSPRREALLLSISAAIAGDVGNAETALSRLARSAALYQSIGDYNGLAWIGTQEAGTYLAAGSAEVALKRAEEVIALPNLELRLEMLAKGIAIEALILLGRTREASTRFSEFRSFYTQFPDKASRVSYLEALLLAAAGQVRDAERRFRDSIQAFLDLENYKAAFNFYLTLFEVLFQRRAFSKAEALCEEVLANPVLLAGRPAVRKAWEDLLVLVRAKSLELNHIIALRQFCLRYWNASAPHGSFTKFAVSAAPQTDLAEDLGEVRQAEQSPIGGALAQSRETLIGDAYHAALHEKERELFAAALETSGYSIRRTSRVLGMSRNTVKDKVRRFGLEPLLNSSDNND